MRKVKKSDEIPLKMLEPSSIERRRNQFNNREIQAKTRHKVGKLIPWLESLTDTKLPLRPVMNRIYNDIDYFMQNEIRPFSVCTKGCAHCCSVPVQVSLLEADYIAQKTSVKIHHVVKDRYEMPKSVDGYCPLLDQETALCSVYEYRPLACRLFATMDSWKFCEKSDQKHYIHTFESQPLFTMIHEFLLVQSKHNAKPLNVAAVAEIRDWFK